MGKHKNGRRGYGENAENRGENRAGEARSADRNESANRQPSVNGKNSQKRPEKKAETQGVKHPENTKNRFKGNENSQKRRENNQPKKNASKNSVEDRKDTYVYELDGKLYINLTNKCSNGCEFCVRNERASYYGNYLWIRHGDPDAAAVISALGEKDLSSYKELVFCGFGEPTYKMSEMLAVADFAHEKGLKTRLNTNGQGNLVNKRDIVSELKGKIDFVNVSLNAPDAESYQKVCHSMFRLDAFPAIVEFAKSCVKNGVPCRFSVVDCIGEDAVSACKRLADSVKVPLYVRKYIADS